MLFRSEEVGRIYGVNNIKGKLPVTSMKKGSYDKTTRQIRNKMISLGYNEVLSYSLVNEEEASQYTNDSFEVVKLMDPLTEDRSCLRYSMIPSLMKIWEYNKKRNIKDISIFEIGKGFYKKDTYGENNRLCALMYGSYYLGLHNKKVDFYMIKGIVEELLDYLGYQNRYSFTTENIPKELHPGISASISVNRDTIGIIGKVHPSITKEDIYIFEINLDQLLEKKVGKMKYKEISKFPGITKDLAFIVDKNVTAGEIGSTIKKVGGRLLKEVRIFDVYTGDKLHNNQKSIAFSLYFEDSKRTLSDEEVMEIFNKIIEKVSATYHATLRDK